MRCTACGYEYVDIYEGHPIFLGQLGKVEWYRCRYCHTVFPMTCNDCGEIVGYSDDRDYFHIRDDADDCFLISA